MQKTLTFTYDNKKYVSKPWDFEAACRVQEAILGGANGIGRTGGDAVDYLFEGTDATQDILNAAISEKMDLCRTAVQWYLDDMNRITEKNADTPAKETAAEN